jgi:hypothetical protein
MSTANKTKPSAPLQQIQLQNLRYFGPISPVRVPWHPRQRCDSAIYCANPSRKACLKTSHAQPWSSGYPAPTSQWSEYILRGGTRNTNIQMTTIPTSRASAINLEYPTALLSFQTTSPRQLNSTDVRVEFV